MKKDRKSNRNIHLYGEINDDTIQKIVYNIDTLYEEDPIKTIHMYISSGGGRVSAGFAFYDYIKSMSKVKLHTFALGGVGSMAIIIFLTGVKRTAGPNASFFFHELGRNFKEASLSCSDLKTHSNELIMSQKKYIDIINKNTNMEIEAITDLLKNEVTVEPEEALKLGILHKIL